jgi:hypothetical protein
MKAVRSGVLSAVAVTLGLISTSVGAVQIFWTDWTGTNAGAVNGAFQAQGTLTTNTTSIGVTYANPNGVGFYQATGGTDYYTGGAGATSPYTSSVVDNRPTGTDIVALSKAGTQTLTFSQTIANPVFAFVSLNGNGYAFDQDFELLSLGGVDGNACGFWGCGGATKVVVDLGGGNFEYQLNSNGVGGSEPHGALRFTGAFDTVTWRSSTNEFWNGFTVGVQGSAAEVFEPPPVTAIPEPEVYALMLAGLAMVGAMRRRSSRSAQT